MVLTAPEKSKPPLARYYLRLPLPRVAPASSRLVDPTTDLSQIKISVIPSAARDPSSIFALISQLTRLSSRPKWPVLLFRAIPSATGHAVEVCPEPRKACPEPAKGICFFRLATRHSPLATAFPARSRPSLPIQAICPTKTAGHTNPAATKILTTHKLHLDPTPFIAQFPGLPCYHQARSTFPSRCPIPAKPHAPFPA